MANELKYLEIPAKYFTTYKKLLHALADFGKDIIKDCDKNCNSLQSNVISCWNLFQCALACYELNRIKEADLYISYIENQLNIVYKNSNIFIVGDDEKEYPIFAGFNASEIPDFELTLENKMYKWDSSTIGEKYPIGSYILVNEVQGYIWFFIPEKYEIEANRFFTDGDLALNVKEFDTKVININNESITYRCYRALSSSINGTFVVHIK